MKQISELANKPPFTDDKAIADIMEAGREDCGYIQERKAIVYIVSADSFCPDVQPNVCSLLQKNCELKWLMVAGVALNLWHLNRQDNYNKPLWFL